MSPQMLEVSPVGAGAVLRPKRDAWSMVKGLRQATNAYAPLPPPPPSTPLRDTGFSTKIKLLGLRYSYGKNDSYRLIVRTIG